VLLADLWLGSVAVTDPPASLSVYRTGLSNPNLPATKIQLSLPTDGPAEEVQPRATQGVVITRQARLTRFESGLPADSLLDLTDLHGAGNPLSGGLFVGTGKALGVSITAPAGPSALADQPITLRPPDKSPAPFATPAITGAAEPSAPDSQVFLRLSPQDAGSSNSPPVAANYSYTVVHDRHLVVDEVDGLLSDSYDPDGDPLQVLIVTAPAHGSLETQSMPTDGAFSYVPNTGYVGTDSFTYKLWDGLDESSVATVTISVTNYAPEVASKSFTLTEGQVLTGDVLAGAYDPDGDPLQSMLVSNPSHGDLVLHDDGTFIYTPSINYYGSDSFSYAVTDGVATTTPLTANLTITSAGPFDLDGHDAATLTPWMSEPDEVGYGLQVSTTSSAQIFLRVYDVPDGWIVTDRRVSWDPNVLAVNGVTWPGYIDLDPAGGNEVMTVTALVTGYGESKITYSAAAKTDTGGGMGFGPEQAPDTGGVVPFGLGQGFATDIDLEAVEQKAVLRQLEFTSDHNVIRKNTRNVLTSGDRYNDVEFVRATEYSAPMTQTMSYPGMASKMKVKVTWDWSGIPTGTVFKLVGKGTDTAMQFESGLFTTNAVGNSEIEVTATNDVGNKVRTINDVIDWKMVLNPGAANEEALHMGTSGTHKIYVLFNSPAAQDREPFQVTDIRLDRTVAVASKALENARAAVTPAVPTWQRIAYHVVQLQRFNLDWRKNVLQGPPTDENLPKGWKVPDTWTGLPGEGTDCVSGAAFSWLVVVTSGMSLTANVDALAAKSATEPTKAVVFAPDDPARLRNGGREELILRDHSGQVNRFEAALIVTPPGTGASTFYFPVGADDARFTNKDDVITIFADAVWVRRNTNAVLPPPVWSYTRAANVSID
jgi:hypothetical protein